MTNSDTFGNGTSRGNSSSGTERIEVPDDFSNPAFEGAWRKGAEAAVNGESRSSCPYDYDNYGSQGVTFSRAFWKRWQSGYDAYEDRQQSAGTERPEGA